MSRILLRRITIAAALAVLLTLAAPVQAAGWNGWASDGDLLQATWQWIASFWAPQAPAHHSRRIIKADRSSSIDPNGQVQSDRGVGIDPDGLKSDRGSGIDPNGLVQSDRSTGIDPNG